MYEVYGMVRARIKEPDTQAAGVRAYLMYNANEDYTYIMHIPTLRYFYLPTTDLPKADLKPLDVPSYRIRQQLQDKLNLFEAGKGGRQLDKKDRQEVTNLIKALEASFK